MQWSGDPGKINQLSDEELKSIGTSNSKVRCIRGITEAVMYGDLVFEKMHELSNEEVLYELTKLHGIGN